jgi:hypothetical protein
LSDGERDRIAEQAAQTRLPVAVLFHAAPLSRFRNSENVKMNGRWAMRLAEKIFAECPIRSFIEECRSLRASGHAFA